MPELTANDGYMLLLYSMLPEVGRTSLPLKLTVTSSFILTMIGHVDHIVQ